MCDLGSVMHDLNFRRDDVLQNVFPVCSNANYLAVWHHAYMPIGILVLKEEQKLAVEALLSGKDIMAVLPTGFGKSIIYQSFVMAKNFANTASSSIVVVVPLRSIIDTLGARDFSCAVSGFGQAFGRKVIPLRARKTSGTQGILSKTSCSQMTLVNCLRKDPTIIKRHWCQQVPCNFRLRGTSFVGRIHRLAKGRILRIQKKFVLGCDR